MKKILLTIFISIILSELAMSDDFLVDRYGYL